MRTIVWGTSEVDTAARVCLRTDSFTPVTSTRVAREATEVEAMAWVRGKFTTTGSLAIPVPTPPSLFVGGGWDPYFFPLLGVPLAPPGG